MTARPYEPFLYLRSTPPSLDQGVPLTTYNTLRKPCVREIDCPRPKDFVRDGPGRYGPGNTHNIGLSARAFASSSGSSGSSHQTHSLWEDLRDVRVPWRSQGRHFVLPGLRQLGHTGFTHPIFSVPNSSHNRLPISNRRTELSASWPLRSHSRSSITPIDACSVSSYVRQASPRAHLAYPSRLKHRDSVLEEHTYRPNHPAVDRLNRGTASDARAHRYEACGDKFTESRRPQVPSPSRVSSILINTRYSLEDATGTHAISTPKIKPKKKRKVRICTATDCDKLVVDRGVCIRHGGGKRCNVEGCGCRAQHKGLCWKHGGYTICQVEGCSKRAKSRGMCWSHGGGTQCTTDGCVKVAVSRGHCWAHGGGKRCKLPSCQKPAAVRMNDYCAEHYAITHLKPTSDTSNRFAS